MTLHYVHPANPPTSPPHTLETAVWRTVAYGDVFDYPPTPAEIHRYLEGVTTSLPAVTAVLQNGRLQHTLSYIDGYVTLTGREDIVAIRRQRTQHARQIWPAAIRYGRFIAHLPFVRMVAVTGSLAVDNVDAHGDVDYLVVTANGRLWLTRALIIAVVRAAALRGLTLCPNYLLTENALEFTDRSLYTARELTQMVPLAGLDVYRQMRRANRWTDDYVPNAVGPPRRPANIPRRRWQQWLERPLRTPPGQWLENWEQSRKIKKLRAQHDTPGETDFCADWCKGHFDPHRQRTLTAFRHRLETTREP